MKNNYVDLQTMINNGEFDKETFWSRFATLQKSQHNGLVPKLLATAGNLVIPVINLAAFEVVVVNDAQAVLRTMGLRCKRSQVQLLMFTWCATDTVQAISAPDEYLRIYFNDEGVA